MQQSDEPEHRLHTAPKCTARHCWPHIVLRAPRARTKGQNECLNEPKQHQLFALWYVAICFCILHLNAENRVSDSTVGRIWLSLVHRGQAILDTVE